jgi:hypothetical protein
VSENAKNDEKSQKHVFLLKIGTFQERITQWKLDQNWTYYSVLESTEKCHFLDSFFLRNEFKITYVRLIKITEQKYKNNQTNKRDN